MLLIWQCAIIFVLVANNYSNGNRSQNSSVTIYSDTLGTKNLGFWFLKVMHVEDFFVSATYFMMPQSCFTPIL